MNENFPILEIGSNVHDDTDHLHIITSRVMYRQPGANEESFIQICFAVQSPRTSRRKYTVHKVHY